MDVSIIIPALNEEKQIGRLLSSIDNQSSELEYETIVVDNGSDDKTSQIAEKNGAMVLYIPKGCHISTVRNFGAKHARGEILVFIDSDCEVVGNWLLYGYKSLMEADNIGILGGPYTPNPVKTTWIQKAWDSVRVKGKREVNFITSGNLFIKKKIFDKFGGFDDQHETGEDYDLCLRVSKEYKIVSDEKLSVIHYGDPATLLHRFKKEIWYGKNIINIIRDKPLYFIFWASIIFGLSNLTLAFGMLLTSKIIIFASILVAGIILIVISFFRCLRARNFRYFFELTIIYWCYLLARCISILLSLFLKKRSIISKK